MRGSAFIALMYGPKMSARKRTWPSRTPNTMPPSTPKMKPSSASLIVIQICSQSVPNAVPCSAQYLSFVTTPLGCPKKNGSTIFQVVNSCQPPTMITNTAARPRGAVQEIRFEPRFLELHHQIWASLRDEVERAYARTAQAPAGGQR